MKEISGTGQSVLPNRFFAFWKSVVHRPICTNKNRALAISYSLMSRSIKIMYLRLLKAERLVVLLMKDENYVLPSGFQGPAWLSLREKFIVCLFAEEWGQLWSEPDRRSICVCFSAAAARQGLIVIMIVEWQTQTDFEEEITASIGRFKREDLPTAFGEMFVFGGFHEWRPQLERGFTKKQTK